MEENRRNTGQTGTVFCSYRVNHHTVWMNGKPWLRRGLLMWCQCRSLVPGPLTSVHSNVLEIRHFLYLRSAGQCEKVLSLIQAENWSFLYVYLDFKVTAVLFLRKIKSQVRQSRVCQLLSMWISSIWGPLSFCSNRFMSSPLTYNHTDEKTSNPSPIALCLGLETHPEGASECRGGGLGSVTAVHHQGVAWSKKSLRGIWMTFTGVKKLNQYFSTYQSIVLFLFICISTEGKNVWKFHTSAVSCPCP